MMKLTRIGLAVNYNFTYYRSVLRGIARYAEAKPRWLFTSIIPEQQSLQALGRLRIGENVEEILKADMEAEQSGAKLYRDVIAHAESVRDYVTRDLAREILSDEEKHIDFIETQFEMIERMGLHNYIQLQSKPAEE